MSWRLEKANVIPTFKKDKKEGLRNCAEGGWEPNDWKIAEKDWGSGKHKAVHEPEMHLCGKKG